MGFGTLIAFFVAAFSGVFTIVNPFSTASVFLAMTQGDSKKKKKAMARKACITAAVVLIVFGLAGTFILNFFSITLEAFKIAGGILVFGVGYGMVTAQKKAFDSEQEKKEAMSKEDISIIPLAIPMMSGPGAMTTAMVLMLQASGFLQMLAVVVAVIIVCLITYLLLLRASILERVLGETGKLIMNKILGLIVLVVGIQFVINGVHGVLVSFGYVSSM